MSFDYLFSLYRLEYCHYCVTQRQIYPPIQFLMNQSNYLFKYAYSNLHTIKSPSLLNSSKKICIQTSPSTKISRLKDLCSKWNENVIGISKYIRS